MMTAFVLCILWRYSDCPVFLFAVFVHCSVLHSAQGLSVPIRNSAAASHFLGCSHDSVSDIRMSRLLCVVRAEYFPCTHFTLSCKTVAINSHAQSVQVNCSFHDASIAMLLHADSYGKWFALRSFLAM